MPVSVIKLVFGRPFLLYHRSGFHSPQPWPKPVSWATPIVRPLSSGISGHLGTCWALWTETNEPRGAVGERCRAQWVARPGFHLGGSSILWRTDGLHAFRCRFAKTGSPHKETSLYFDPCLPNSQGPCELKEVRGIWLRLLARITFEALCAKIGSACSNHLPVPSISGVRKGSTSTEAFFGWQVRFT